MVGAFGNDNRGAFGATAAAETSLDKAVAATDQTKSEQGALTTWFLDSGQTRRHAAGSYFPRWP
jgi:hypothetical protein